MFMVVRTLATIGIPYSEHSSFFELTCFALSVPGPDVKMIATVNVGNERRLAYRHDLKIRVARF
jgi:hypothetical protein